ncbi:hypothetical protein QJS04_geneDACA017838 [Acorus gramineus]|uniref:Uncharacterized protein n=1 Tax=Acorus gramineus TaxID=55184 RepID=A0AAV9AKM9_ACOGR|nr:hypothetical protein QJS04_geneDACA017838 [Acorus gramineus]
MRVAKMFVKGVAFIILLILVSNVSIPSATATRKLTEGTQLVKEGMRSTADDVKPVPRLPRPDLQCGRYLRYIRRCIPPVP